MACRDVTGFDAYIRERLAESKSEAARVVLEFVEKDCVNMGDAVLLAIEALPTSKTREIRRMVDLFEPWCEWMDKWFARGWRLEMLPASNNRVVVHTPNTFDHRTSTYPAADIVAAALGVEKVAFIGHFGEHDGKCPNCDVYKFYGKVHL